jgi:hypothetical protein
MIDLDDAPREVAPIGLGFNRAVARQRRRQLSSNEAVGASVTALSFRRYTNQ